MELPHDFHFSQGSLQDYVDCPRRFHLRYLLRLAWPAQEAEPPLESERHLRQGAAFHRLIHQHLLGVPPGRLSRALVDPDLRRWWEGYRAAPPADLPETRYPEVVLSAPAPGPGESAYRLVAKYDLVAVEPGQRAVIVDWKTSQKRPWRERLAGRLQTRVYAYLLVRAGRHLNAGRPVAPEQVEMIYWFANFPREPERFAYDEAQYEADGKYLAALIEDIGGLGADDFHLTAQERRCRYCVYRSLCRRGAEAGAWGEREEELEPELEEDFSLTLDFEQIAEVEY